MSGSKNFFKWTDDDYDEEVIRRMQAGHQNSISSDDYEEIRNY